MQVTKKSKIQQASHLILNMYYRLKRIQRVGRQFTIGPITVFLLVRKKKLPYQTNGKMKVEWLANDVAAVTYKTADHKTQQFIGTYGDRGSGRSYYYVGAEIHGKWEGGNAEVISDQEGITVTQNGETELFDWDHIQQFGTLAVVLMKDDEAVWTISLNENFKVDSAASTPPSGNISLYKATMKENKPITLQFKTSNTFNTGG